MSVTGKVTSDSIQFILPHEYAAGLLYKLLLSHDDGWSVETRTDTLGEKTAFLREFKFKKIRVSPYRPIFEHLLPKLNWTVAEQEQVLHKNPIAAFQIEILSKK
ncbi:MAG: hypothetical protein AAF847_13235 [Bacteroidota bacterium]